MLKLPKVQIKPESQKCLILKTQRTKSVAYSNLALVPRAVKDPEPPYDVSSNSVSLLKALLDNLSMG